MPKGARTGRPAVFVYPPKLIVGVGPVLLNGSNGSGVATIIGSGVAMMIGWVGMTAGGNVGVGVGGVHRQTEGIHAVRDACGIERAQRAILHLCIVRPHNDREGGRRVLRRNFDGVLREVERLHSARELDRALHGLAVGGAGERQHRVLRADGTGRGRRQARQAGQAVLRGKRLASGRGQPVHRGRVGHIQEAPGNHVVRAVLVGQQSAPRIDIQRLHKALVCAQRRRALQEQLGAHRRAVLRHVRVIQRACQRAHLRLHDARWLLESRVGALERGIHHRVPHWHRHAHGIGAGIGVVVTAGPHAHDQVAAVADGPQILVARARAGLDGHPTGIGLQVERAAKAIRGRARHIVGQDAVDEESDLRLYLL
jgi:hypothetical protein